MSRYDAAYTGSRFFKCDLHMHGPGDPAGWRGTMAKTDQERTALAAAYVRRCYEVGLEVVAITNHNFADPEFLPLMRKAVDAHAQEFGYQLTIFPGFEITANVGKGCHILALFAAEEEDAAIASRLTRCGIRHPPFKGETPERSTLGLEDILAVVQEKGADGLPVGLVVCPHCQGDDGIFDNDSIAEWLQQKEFTNPKLLCLEVPKALERMSAGWQKLFRAGNDCQAGWRRRRQIALIQSSDAKDIGSENGVPNHIGWRYCWIKMSAPSIESLRQAFLDPESRIRLGSNPPDEECVHPWIRRLHTRNAVFLSDADLSFSQNLNVIIGGRGSGKSTLVEYLRLALAQQEGIPSEARASLEGIKGTITDATSISVDVVKEGKPAIAATIGSGAPILTAEVVIPDVARFFPVRVVSQREIFALASNAGSHLRFVDDLVRRRLDDIARSAADTAGKIGAVDAEIATLPELAARRAALLSEIKDYEWKLERLREVGPSLERWRGYRAEERQFAKLREECERVKASLAAWADQAVVSIPDDADLAFGPNRALSELVTEKVCNTADLLRQEVLAAASRFSESVAAIFDDRALGEWEASRPRESARYAEVKTKVLEQGSDPEEYLAYTDALRSRQGELVDVDKKVGAQTNLEQARDGAQDPDGRPVLGLIQHLHQNWADETAARREVAALLQANVPLTRGGRPFVTVEIEAFGDREAFRTRLHSVPDRDRRKLADEEVDELAAAVSAYSENRNQGEVLWDWIRTVRGGQRPGGYPWRVGTRQSERLVEWLTPSIANVLRTWRTPDRAKVELYREDGSRVGELQGRQLSAGQRCTAVLALLLAAGEAPIVIDQPEDDLDSEFVFHELVPLLRHVKAKRQVIVVSHNANIPVNGDAEFIVAMAVSGGRGCVKKEHVRQTEEEAQGALDRTAVKLAVENIMEGSQEAFERRYEKYGF